MCLAECGPAEIEARVSGHPRMNHELEPLETASPSVFRDVDLVLTDMDDTLTRQGRLAAQTYSALERLQLAGVRIIPVTAAPAGWCDQMALMWPVTAVIGENGGFAFQRVGSGVHRIFWHSGPAASAFNSLVSETARQIRAAVPDAELADDQPFRLTSIAFKRPASRGAAAAIARELEALRFSVTINSIWVLGWQGDYDKLSAARRFLPQIAGADVDADRDRIAFAGDSANDAPMFAHFPKSVGVSTVVEHLPDIRVKPSWITRGGGGEGFVELADAILAAKRL